MRIVYMGTPDFAVAPLKALLQAGKNVVAVVTMPDKPIGRGHKLGCSAVKSFALEQGLDILQPQNLKDPAFIEQLRSYNADLQIVVAFRMLPEVVWNMPPMGTFNLHASLLPEYRGAAPINWAVINGDTQTGVTTFFLKHEIDTGNIIMQERCAIEPDDNAGTIHDKLMNIGAELVVKTVDAIEQGNVKTYEQPDVPTRPAPKIFKDTCTLNFDNKAVDLHNLIRGLSPYPAARVDLQMSNGELTNMKITHSHTELCQHNKSIGELVVEDKKVIKVACQDGYIVFDRVQLAGKKNMAADELLRGTDLSQYKVITI